jgi:SAM-dependent methyltransferase
MMRGNRVDTAGTGAKAGPVTEPRRTITDDDAALLYDVENTWDRVGWPADRFYSDAVAAAGSVLDVGCGTGSMLHTARAEGHRGRLVGVDPDEAMLARARGGRSDVEWVLATAAEMTYDAEFELAVMASNAFQCFVTDDELRVSLAAIRRALVPGGSFVFGTRHLQARAWEAWNPSNAGNLVLPGGREVRGWLRVERVEGPLVTVTETTALPDGTPLRVSGSTLRFHTPETLNPALVEAGFRVECQYGDWLRGALDALSREIITVARAQ